MERAAERLRAELAGGATLRRTEIEALLGKRVAHGIGLWVDLVRVPPSGTWERRRADLLRARRGLDRPAGRRRRPGRAPRRALPARVRAGVAQGRGELHRAQAGRAQARAGGARARVASPSEDGEELLDVPGGAAAGRRRSRRRCGSCRRGTRRCSCTRGGRASCPSASGRSCFHVRMPQSVPTFLVDGEVAGTWKWVDGEIVLEEFEPLPAGAREAVEAAAGPLAAFHA